MKNSALLVACAQMTIQADCRANSATMLRMMRRAAKMGARLIQFPEGALSGYIKSQIKQWPDFAWNRLQTELKKICLEAERLKIWVVTGSVHQLPFPFRPYNCLYVIDDHGRICARYDKRFISNSELKCWFTPGKEPLVFTVDGWRIGLSVCIEINFPELFLEYARLQTDAILCSSYSDNPTYQLLARAHAATNCCWFSLAIPANTSAAAPSLIVGPDGIVLKSGHKNRENLLISELDPEDERFQVALTRARPWREKVRSENFYQPHQFSQPADKS